MIIFYTTYGPKKVKNLHVCIICSTSCTKHVPTKYILSDENVCETFEMIISVRGASIPGIVAVVCTISVRSCWLWQHCGATRPCCAFPRVVRRVVLLPGGWCVCAPCVAGRDRFGVIRERRRQGAFDHDLCRSEVVSSHPLSW